MCELIVILKYYINVLQKFIDLYFMPTSQLKIIKIEIKEYSHTERSSDNIWYLL